jgi:ATP-dependent Clp protease ATP-binding subunit ClpB
VRMKPFSVILLDEIEKAHPDVFNVLLQVLDDGRLTDNKGRVVNFKNTLIIMTSNLGSSIIQQYLAEWSEATRDRIMEHTREEVFQLVKQTFRPEFLNRIDELILFTPLSADEVKEIVRLQLAGLVGKLAEQDIRLQATEAAIDRIAGEGYDPQYGARPIKRMIQKNLLNELSRQLLAGKVKKGQTVLVDGDQDGIHISATG